jgi:hypothetical protein
MNFVIGVLFLCLSVVSFGMEMLFFRNPKLPKWADGFVFMSMGALAIIGLGATGLVIITFTFAQIGVIGYLHLLLSAALVCATALTLWSLHIPKKLKEYVEQKAAIISFKPAEVQSGSGNGSTPKKGRLAA